MYIEISDAARMKLSNKKHQLEMKKVWNECIKYGICPKCGEEMYTDHAGWQTCTKHGIQMAMLPASLAEV